MKTWPAGLSGLLHRWESLRRLHTGSRVSLWPVFAPLRHGVGCMTRAEIRGAVVRETVVALAWAAVFLGWLAVLLMPSVWA